MTKTEVLNLIKANKNERGIANWKKFGYDRKYGLRSFGIGLTQLRKLAKKVGKDHELAQKLWASDVYDAKVIALLIDDPKTMTREQAETQVEQVEAAQLEHVFSSCDATLAKTPFVVDLAGDWIESEDPVRRSCGYGLLYEISKWTKKSTPDEAYFLGWVRHIGATFDQELRSVQGSMGGALMGMGKRTAALNRAALKVARAIGPIEFDTPSGQCEPFDVAKHLTSDYLRKKLGV